MERRVVIVAVPEVQPLDVTGPAEVFAAAATAAAASAGTERSGYAVEVVAPRDAGPSRRVAGWPTTSAKTSPSPHSPPARP